MIQGVIFDMDGLMFDTERMWATFWEPALAALGLPYKEGLAEAERGTAGETSRNIVRSFYGEDCDANAIIDSLHRVADKVFQKPVPKKPGLDELLAWLDEQHIPMAVASSSRMHIIQRNLDNWGLTHYFKTLASGQRGGGRLRHRDGARPAPRRRRDAQPVHGRVQEPDRGAGASESKRILSKKPPVLRWFFLSAYLQPTMISIISRLVSFMPCLPRRPTFRREFSTPLATMPSPPRNCWPRMYIL